MKVKYSPNHRVGHNEVIGVCRTGLDAKGLGRDHWNEMLTYHRKPITHWQAPGDWKRKGEEVSSQACLLSPTDCSHLLGVSALTGGTPFRGHPLSFAHVRDTPDPVSRPRDTVAQLLVKFSLCPLEPTCVILWEARVQGRD